jgi:hypothetical protein
MNVKTSQPNNLIEQMTPVKDTSDLQLIKNKDLDKSEDTRFKKIAEDVFSVKSKQFVFDCGIIMGNLNYIDSSIRFCMNYHYNNTDNFEQFLQSIKDFIGVSGHSLSENDIKRLENDYNFKTTGKVTK